MSSGAVVLRGASLVDGTGAPSRAADVRVEAGRIDRVGSPGTVHGEGDEIVDLDGLTLAPGFIDPHTHLDAQVMWDPDLTPSSWHGVTTVLMGNCGFGITPALPEHHDVLVRTLENVEGMSADALRAGVMWDYTSFDEYLDLLGRLQPRLNVAVLVGHTPVRLHAMGDAAYERAATDDEVARMETLVRDAVAAGAVGFSTSRSANHQGAEGRPVPSRFATMEEAVRLGGAAIAAGAGLVQVATGPDLNAPQDLAAFSQGVGGPVTWIALLADEGKSGQAMARLEASRALDPNLWAQIACRPIVTQTSMRSPTAFGMCPAFADVLALPPERRSEPYRDEAWRERARADADAQWGHRWGKITIQESATHAHLVHGPSVAELAAQRGCHPLDVMLDVALADDLTTRFRLLLLNDDDAEIGRLLAAEGTLLGLSDAGAHASQLCDACYTTDLLGRWVRDLGAVSLERAVWHLTGNPAELMGLTDRGRVAEGLRADLVAFDPSTVGAGPLERVHDLPAGADRLISRSSGIEHVWVNGVRTRAAGVDIDGVRPGSVLRG